MRKASIFLIITVLSVSLIGCSQRIEEASNDELPAPSSSFSAGETEESPMLSEEPTATPEIEPPQSTESKSTDNTPAADGTSTPTQKPQSKSDPGVSQPAQSQPPAETPKPSTPSQPPATPEPPKEKSIYDYEFDVAAIKNELIAIGQGMGLTHITTDDGIVRTPDNSSWAQPVTASKDFQGESLKRALKDYVSSMPGIVKNYGGNAVEYFTIYVKPLGNGSYTFYFLY